MDNGQTRNDFLIAELPTTPAEITEWAFTTDVNEALELEDSA
jgi:hypothetical protein